MRRLFLISLIISGACALPQLAPVRAQAVTNLTSCQTITASGSYRLANDVSGNGWCFSIRAADVTFDGNGKTITSSSGEALEVAHYSGSAATNVTVSNFTSTGGVRTYGDAVNHVTFAGLTVSDIVVYGSDDVTIRNNTVGSGGINVNDADNDWHPLRPTVTNNVITGAVGHTTKILLEVVGGKFHPCPRLDATVTGNTVDNHRNDPPAEANASVRIRCATHTVFTGNTIRSRGTTIGLYMRDESDDGRYEDNTFWTRDHEALRIASGNEDKTFPSRNRFSNNVFRSDEVATLYLQGVGTKNVFQNNLFWGATGGLSMINGAFETTWDHNTFYVTDAGSLTTLSYRTGPPADVWTNNIVSYASGAVFGYDGWANTRYSGDYNLFDNRSGAVSFGSVGSTLAGWRSETGADQHSFEADPLFVDPAAGDFRLAAGSPARGRASDGTDLGYRAGAAPQPMVNAKPYMYLYHLPHLQRVTGRRTITVTAKDSDGIAQVIFSVDGKRLAVDRTAPYSLVLDSRPLRNGRHTLTVTAVDRLGAQTVVRRAFVSANRLSIETTTPVARARVRGVITLKPKLVYGGSTIRRAGYAIDGRTLRTVTKAPWSTTWNTARVRNGWHTITFSIRDAAGVLAKKTVRVFVRN